MRVPGSSSRLSVRYSLRGLLVATAIIAIWLAVQVKWHNDRQQARRWIAEHEAGNWSLIDTSNPDTQITVNGRRTRPTDYKDVPWILRIFGEKPLTFIVLDRATLSKTDVPRIRSFRSRFPEAEQVQIQEPYRTTGWPPKDLEAFFEEPVRP
jgi:hypothetical protein